MKGVFVLCMSAFLRVHAFVCVSFPQCVSDSGWGDECGCVYITICASLFLCV